MTCSFPGLDDFWRCEALGVDGVGSPGGFDEFRLIGGASTIRRDRIRSFKTCGLGDVKLGLGYI